MLAAPHPCPDECISHWSTRQLDHRDDEIAHLAEGAVFRSRPLQFILLVLVHGLPSSDVCSLMFVFIVTFYTSPFKMLIFILFSRWKDIARQTDRELPYADLLLKYNSQS